MKKVKLFSLAAATLLAVSPVISIPTTSVVQAAQVSKVSSSDIYNHFLRNTKIMENGHRINGNVFINNPRLSHNTNSVDIPSSTQLVNGTYQLSATINVSGFTPSSKDRTFDIVDNYGNIIGTVSVAANSSLAQGGSDFEFKVSNGKIGKSSLGTITNNSSKPKPKKHAKKHHAKKRHKKSHKKSHKKHHKKAHRKSSRR